MMLSQPYLDEIRARWEAVGGFAVKVANVPGGHARLLVGEGGSQVELRVTREGDPAGDGDVLFVGHAFSDIPRLLEVLESGSPLPPEDAAGIGMRVASASPGSWTAFIESDGGIGGADVTRVSESDSEADMYLWVGRPRPRPRFTASIAPVLAPVAAAEDAPVIQAHWRGLLQAGMVAGAVGLTVVNVLQGGLDPATDAAEAADVTALAADATADTATAADATTDTAAEDGADAEEAAASCGGMSFTAETRVLLASGAAVPIASLKPGDKVLATSTKTGKTQAEPVTAVLVHHDTDLYDLTVKTARGTAVIDTTSSHLFWDPYLHRWVAANKLSKNERLQTPDGQVAVVVSGSAPADRDGWMWDLTVPGNNDHDFYIDVAGSAVLVHNDSCPNPYGRLGGPAHQAEVDRIANDITDRGLTPQTEYRVETPGGFKPVRYVDVAGLDPEGDPVEFYQVGRQTAGGFPVMRESQAIWDIWSVSDVPVTFVPYP